MKKNLILKIGIIFIAVFLLLGIFYVIHIDEVTLKEEIKITIQEGAGTKSIAKNLKNNGIIKNTSAFVFFIKQKDATASLKPGNYKFGPGKVDFDNILETLLKGNQAEAILVTIPEGYTVKQIAAMLSQKGLVDETKFLEYAGSMELPYDYMEKGNDYRQLEGFLFPETYSIPLTWTEKEIIQTMLNQFDKVWTEDYQKKADALGFSVKEIVTIASLIEREAKIDSERKTISSVIHNRLKIGMLLQIDATIQYLLPEQKERLLYKDLEVDSPYNTYKYKGLPPTPIASPGKACIEAALEPEETPYLYYRAKAVGNGEHYFSQTLEEHNSYKGK
ncbi:MAG: endolytic transglycosylase MltG [Clostridia bacterium]|nr:endolytic transglycosylase MltG [Clostridia bacterium]